MYRMVTISDRFKEIVYKKRDINKPFTKEVKSQDVVFFICEELKEEDFKEPFFNSSQVIFLSDCFKFLSYCGKEQRENLNKNALVITKKLSKNGLFIYRCYLMEKEGFNIRELFLKYSSSQTIGKHNNYSLSPRDYIGVIKESYKKEELIYVINKILVDLTEWSLKQ